MWGGVGYCLPAALKSLEALYGRLSQELYLSIPANILVSLVPRDSIVVFTVATIVSVYGRVGLTTTEFTGPPLSESRERASMGG